MSSNELPSWHGTTILTVRKGGTVVIGGDGQVTIGQTIVKANAKKVRRLGKGDVIGGFAGATADAFTLFEIDLRAGRHWEILLAPAPVGSFLGSMFLDTSRVE